MTRNFPRWLSALTSNRTQSSLLGVGVLALLGVAAGSTVTSTTPDLPVPVAVVAAAPAAASAASDASSAWPAGPASATKPIAAVPAWPAGASAAAPPSADTSAWPASPTSTVKATPKETTPPVPSPALATAGAPATAPQTAATKPAPAPKPAPPAAKTLPHKTVLQPNYYYCGPAAVRIALTAHNKTVSFDALAAQLGTTPNGTNSAVDITRVLNAQLGSRHYRTTSIPGKAATARQIEKLRTDVVNSVADGDPVVANIAGTVTDTAGERHSYEGGHYLTVVGYSDQGRMVTIADPADAVGSPEYQLSIADLANWIATRGYSS